MSKHWWESKTVWFGTAVVALGSMVEYLASASGLWAGYFGEWGGAATVAIGVLNVLLRLRTTKAIKPRDHS